MKPYAEIMFGDFITLAFDQIINHASKFHHIYNGKVTCPVVIRTPMGGRRGYGPTHSQTLDKFLIGIDNVVTLAINTFIDPSIIYESAHKENKPVIVIENKVDYGKKVGAYQSTNFSAIMSNCNYPIVKITPIKTTPSITIVSYGSSADWVSESLEAIFRETDLIPELIILTKIHPIDYSEVLNSIKKTRKLIVIEEGSISGGIGSEIIASVNELNEYPIITRRLGALEVPIPSVKSLENSVLPNIESLIKLIKSI